jgi:hypothetical protein
MVVVVMCKFVCKSRCNAGLGTGESGVERGEGSDRLVEELNYISTKKLNDITNPPPPLAP